MTWESHLFFELIHFFLKKPFHQFQFLFNFHHSLLHDGYQSFLVFLQGRKEPCIIIWKSCHTEVKTLIVYFPHKVPGEKTANVCLCNRKGGFLMGVLNTAWVVHVRKVILSERTKGKKKKKKKNLTCVTIFPWDKAKFLKPTIQYLCVLLVKYVSKVS